MKISTVILGTELQISLRGVFEVNNSLGLAEHLLKLCELLNFEKVTINFSHCEIMCTLGLGELISFRLNEMLFNKTVRIEGAAPELKQQLLELHFNSLFTLE